MPDNDTWSQKEKLHGIKKLKPKLKKIDMKISLYQEDIDKLEWLTKKIKISRSEAIRQMITSQYDFEKIENE